MFIGRLIVTEVSLLATGPFQNSGLPNSMGPNWGRASFAEGLMGMSSLL